MCAKLVVVRALVQERLTAAAEEIFALVERTIAEFEDELRRSKEENQRKQQLLDSLLKPQLHTAAQVRHPAVVLELSNNNQENHCSSRWSEDLIPVPNVSQEPLGDSQRLCVPPNHHRLTSKPGSQRAVSVLRPSHAPKVDGFSGFAELAFTILAKKSQIKT
ncbi:hypothetical protein WMY93_011845 [Mugilogobius chulae]|uniref:Uncharacterized protein n=1 Tax=Mugilogobius chulae TaxID=88201 RepID=A0AAW0P7J2_9GOBI